MVELHHESMMDVRDGCAAESTQLGSTKRKAGTRIHLRQSTFFNTPHGARRSDRVHALSATPRLLASSTYYCYRKMKEDSTTLHGLPAVSRSLPGLLSTVLATSRKKEDSTTHGSNGSTCTLSAMAPMIKGGSRVAAGARSFTGPIPISSTFTKNSHAFTMQQQKMGSQTWITHHSFFSKQSKWKMDP